MDWVLVGDPDNACDPQPQGCFGTVAESYRISKYEVTNAQYAEFLNAVAATDANALYATGMGSGYGGISRDGSEGSYSYDAIEGREQLPVNHVSYWDVVRFANWLHNGQPTGAQDATTTEDGAYTLTPTGIQDNTVERNEDVARVFVPSEDEWYKAAYYDPSETIYFDYPIGTDTPTLCSTPGATANTANCFVNSDVTAVGSYTGSASPSGTFDQGGNVWEWNEAVILEPQRGLRGASFLQSHEALAASNRAGNLATITSDYSTGFRVARLPEPASAFSQLAALFSLLGLRRLRAWGSSSPRQLRPQSRHVAPRAAARDR
jgi:formylglycine-generating enzyme required for sulfatase activity